jgi:hypothetical protein
MGRMSLGQQDALAGFVTESAAVSYVGANSFLITGRDATRDYAPGAVVSVLGSLSAVLSSTYLGGNSTVLIADAICYAGMRSVSRLPGVTLNLASKCVGGAAISSGIWQSYAADNAFTGLMNSMWASSAYNPATGSWLGYHFSAPLKIRWFELMQTLPIVANGGCGGVTSVAWRYSDDGSSWTTVGTYTVEATARPVRIVTGVPAAAHAYWSVQAATDAAVSGACWAIMSLRMGI